MVKVNAYMRITIRVINDGATQQLKDIQNQMNGVKTGSSSTGSQLGGMFNEGLRAMDKFGKGLQSLGRNMTYQFTLPIVAGTSEVVKWQLANETAMTSLQKVYGDGLMPIQQVNSEVTALGANFRVLSDIFGVAQADVINIGAAWAQAGSAGAGLAKETRDTIEATLLGAGETSTVTQDLIALQAQYGLSADQLKQALADLNVIGSHTAIGLGPLLDSFARSASTARTAGVGYKELAAETAALVPATGSAEAAATALKTIYTRLFNPTKDMNDLFVEMGINVASEAWQSKNAAERLQELAAAYEKLNGPQQVVAANILGSRFQVSKFAELMRQLTSDTGNYAKATRDSADETKNMARYNADLGVVLASQPQVIKILWTQIKNLLTEAIVPLLPYLVMGLKMIVSWVDWFTHLSPQIQKTAVVLLALLAVLGPVLSYVGSFILLGLRFYDIWTKVNLLFDGESFLGKLAASLGRDAGRVVGLTYKFFADLFAAHGAGNAALLAEDLAGSEARLGITTGAEAATIAADEAGWLGRLAADAAGWLLFQAQAVLYWGRRIAFSVGGWVAERVASAAGWAAQLVFDAAQWVARLAIDGTGWASRIALSVTEWVSLRAISVAGWASQLATDTAGWAAAGETATIGSLVVESASVSWIPLVIAAVAIAMGIFRDKIWQGVQWAADGMSQLPGVFAHVFTSLIQVVSTAVMDVWHWLSYLNPFQRHSPSLVDNVIAGVDIIIAKYQTLATVGDSLRRAAGAMSAFDIATAPAAAGFEAEKVQDAKDAILPFAPTAGPAIDALVAATHDLKDSLVLIGQEYVKQNAIVLEWSNALDAANADLDRQQKLVDSLTKSEQALSTELSDAKNRLSELMQTPIAGMKAYEDQIFANTEAQKRLRLEILKLNEAGDSVDSLANRMSKLQGDIELLRGQQSDLRHAGASADILAPLGTQISQLESQQTAIQAQAKGVDDLNKQLTKLQDQGEILTLTRDLTFDPLVKQLNDVANAMNEMPFDELLAQVTAEKANVDSLTVSYNAAHAALAEQTALLDTYRAKRDAIQTTYDLEKKKLDELKTAYDGVNQQISDMETALSTLASAAAAAKKTPAESNSQKNFDNSALGDFQDPGAANALSPEGGLPDIEALTKQWQDELNKSFGKIDVFKPLKDMIDRAKQYMRDHAADIGLATLGGLVGFFIGGPFGAAVGVALGVGLSWAAKHASGALLGALIGFLTAGPFGVVIGAILGNHFKTAANLLDAIWRDVIKPVVDGMGEAFRWLGDNVAQPVFTAMGDTFSWLGGIFSDVWSVISPIIEALWHGIQGAWNVIEPILKFFGQVYFALGAIFFDVTYATILVAWYALTRALQFGWDVIKGIFGLIVSFIRNILGPIFVWLWEDAVRPAFGFIVDVIQAAWRDVLHPVFQAMWEFISNVLGPVFVWLWEKTISPVFGSIADGANWLWDSAIRPVFEQIKGWIEKWLVPVFDFLRDRALDAFNFIGNVAGGIWNGIGNAIADGINIGISAINFLIRGINDLSDILPGINFHIDEIPHVGGGGGGGAPHDGAVASAGYDTNFHATGGIMSYDLRRMGPFKTAGPRAIVGEGNPAFPEFVIASDPRYRSRNQVLLQQAATAVGAKEVPQFGIGGVISNIASTLGDGIGNALGPLRRAAATVAFGPFHELASETIDQIGWKTLRGWLKGLNDDVYSSLKGKNNDQPYSGGGDLDGWLSQALRLAAEPGTWLAGMHARAMQESGGDPNAINNWDSNAAAGTPSKGLMQMIDSTFRAYMVPGHGDIWNPVDNAASAARYIAARYGDPYSLPAGGYAMGGLLKMAAGGIIRARSGGIMANVGEGSHDEAVVPLPSDFSPKDLGKKTYNFYGDLSFPNIKSGDDAEEFMRNLESLAG